MASSPSSWGYGYFQLRARGGKTNELILSSSRLPPVPPPRSGPGAREVRAAAERLWRSLAGDLGWSPLAELGGEEDEDDEYAPVVVDLPPSYKPA